MFFLCTILNIFYSGDLNITTGKICHKIPNPTYRPEDYVLTDADDNDKFEYIIMGNVHDEDCGYAAIQNMIDYYTIDKQSKKRKPE